MAYLGGQWSGHTKIGTLQIGKAGGEACGCDPDQSSFIGPRKALPPAFSVGR